ncbi:hypothetical protein QTN47_24385 [Danxiaibacter flavus]|uniref:Tetratricopeptide repeat protein n=1 Tax=Danxiaibacter flavus TaxID=3049108 RepID=A0ABV3ZLF6_9BACT|nr:hypothetical protein QNM32_24390 [Chitinophagaceae bacterium DXS]
MTTRKSIANFLFLLCLMGCKDQAAKYPLPPLSSKLNFKAMELGKYLDNEDSCRKALSLLDSATNIDKNNFLAYYNKVAFLCSLREFRKAITAIDNASRIKPEAHDLYLISGILHRKTNDTIVAQQLFLNSLSICDKALDTMNSTNSDYMMLQSNRILLHVMLNDRKKATYLLNKLNQTKIDSATRQQLQQFVNDDRDTTISKILDLKN